jgi:hypothetical protein
MITFRNITLDDALKAVNRYNYDSNGCIKDADLDIRARRMFAGGLGRGVEKIAEQLEFIRKDYKGATRAPGGRELSLKIAQQIYGNRANYVEALQKWDLSAPRRDVLAVLYDPFKEPAHRRDGVKIENWLVWGTKFWHHLKPDAFPIEDSRVDTFFQIDDYASVDKYMNLLPRLRKFVLEHQAWIPRMREVDGDIDGPTPCSENKLWDKMFYGLYEK